MHIIKSKKLGSKEKAQNGIVEKTQLWKGNDR